MRLEEGVRSPGVEAAVSCPAWVLETELGSSARAVHVLKDRAISAAPQADTECAGGGRVPRQAGIKDAVV